MNRSQLINLFEVNGINDYQLQCADDLLKVFGVKLESLEGFQTLSNENKALFSQFILNFYNAQGIDSKLLIEPLSIYYVVKNETWVQVPGNYGLSFYKSITTILDRNLKPLKVFREYKNDEFEGKGFEEVETDSEMYLRFDYIWSYPDIDKKEWLHVMSENEWY